MTSLRDAYLAYQAEIGTEEVILAQPWVRKTATAEPKALKPSSTNLSIPEGPEFFQTISRALKPAVAKPAVNVVEEAPSPPLSVSLPEFKDLDAYWKYLSEEYPKWFPLRQAQGSATRLARAEGISNPVLALVEIAPSISQTPKVFDGEAGVFLDKMMKAINLDRSQMYLTSIMKTPPSGKAWPRKDIAKMLPYFFRELKLAACPVILLLGETCAQTVLRTGKNLASLSQQLFDMEGLVFSASYHPSDLENNQELKRSAWNDLKWLRPRLDNLGGSHK